MVTVDPRAFALYKVYLGQKDDRDPIKAPRDIAQARAVYTALVAEHEPVRAHGIVPERLGNHQGKPVDGLAHVMVPNGQVYRPLRRAPHQRSTSSRPLTQPICSALDIRIN